MLLLTFGTAAFHGILVALDFEPGKLLQLLLQILELLPIIYENLIPVFADIDDSYNITAEDVEKKITRNTKAVIAVHLAGNPCELNELSQLCEKNNIILIEDFSQAHGAKWEGKKIGSFGKISYGSFQQSKQITWRGWSYFNECKELRRRAFIGVDKAGKDTSL